MKGPKYQYGRVGYGEPEETMSGCHNPILKEWRDERLAEIQSYERTVQEHIDGIKMRAEKYPEPWRSEFISQSIAMGNLFGLVRKLFAIRE